MLKYAKKQDDGNYMVTDSTDERFAASLGMELLDVEQNANDKTWHLISERYSANESALAANRIAELKHFLFETDYKAIKFAEGELTEEEYAETKVQRKSARYEINELEQKL